MHDDKFLADVIKTNIKFYRSHVKTYLGVIILNLVVIIFHCFLIYKFMPIQAWFFCIFLGIICSNLIWIFNEFIFCKLELKLEMERLTNLRIKRDEDFILPFKK